MGLDAVCLAGLGRVLVRDCVIRKRRFRPPLGVIQALFPISTVLVPRASAAVALWLADEIGRKEQNIRIGEPFHQWLLITAEAITRPSETLAPGSSFAHCANA